MIVRSDTKLVHGTNQSGFDLRCPAKGKAMSWPIVVRGVLAVALTAAAVLLPVELARVCAAIAAAGVLPLPETER